MRYQARHGAIIYRRQVVHWLDGDVPETKLIVTTPADIFSIKEILARPVQTSLSF